MVQLSNGGEIIHSYYMGTDESGDNDLSSSSASPSELTEGTQYPSGMSATGGVMISVEYPSNAGSAALAIDFEGAKPSGQSDITKYRQVVNGGSQVQINYADIPKLRMYALNTEVYIYITFHSRQTR